MKTNQAMGTLKHIWDVESVDIHTEYLIYGYSSESGFLLEILEIFNMGCIRKVLIITWSDVIDLKITNKYIRTKFNNMKSIKSQIAK